MQKLKGAIMNNLETNALRIAELMGYKKAVKGSYYTNGDGVYYFPDSITIKFSSYNGLMPIVFECNSGDIDYPININPSQVTAYPGDRLDIYDYKSEPEFIEAIQLACIKYLELKNEN